jgi:hypothetical protein
MICTPYQVKKNKMGGAHGMYGGKGDVHIGFWWENLMERNHLEDLGIDSRVILKWIFKKWVREAWTVLLWLRIGTGGR